MTFTEYQSAFSVPRLDRYSRACLGDNLKAIEAYKSNVRLSQSVFGTLSIFEIALRNQIDAHYKGKFGNDWLRSESSANGFLLSKGCETSLENVTSVISKLGGAYTHDEAITKLGFGFWRYLFAPKEFRAAGSTLLRIFPKKPIKRGIRQGDIFNRLSDINHIRNRIAHHEPICFNGRQQPIRLSDAYSRYRFNNVVTLLRWMDFDPNYILKDISEFDKEALFLKAI